MDGELKYIMFQDNTFIVLDCTQSHNNFSCGDNSFIKSAGFCRFYPEGDKIQVSCYGQSTTLKKQAEEIDSKILTIHFNGRF
jgi:hypothetical protein